MALVINLKVNAPIRIKSILLIFWLPEADSQNFETNTSLYLDKIGKSGLELIYEDHLRGESGIESKG